MRAACPIEVAMLTFGEFRQERTTDFQTAQNLLAYAWAHRTLPPLHEVTVGSIATPFATFLLVNLSVILLTPHGRRRTWEIVEAVLASLLMVCLIVAVLGMPIGATYLVLKAAAYFLRASLNFLGISQMLGAITKA